jgi:YD repeat-containing protein
MTDAHVFQGGEPHPPPADDPDMWKVGLEKSSTIVLKDDAGDDLQTVITTHVWQQSDSDEFSTDLRWSSAWDACGGTRRSGYQKYVKPTSVTRVVKRHDSVPDDPPSPPPEPATYTTVTSDFDDWGNPGLITETSDDDLERTTHLTYWPDGVANNQLTGFVQGHDVDPGGLECRQYDALGRLSHTFTNPQPAVVHEDDVSLCVASGSITGAREVAFTYDDNGNLATKTEEAADSRITTYENYKYGSPQDTKVSSTDIHYCRDYGPLGTVSWETDGRVPGVNYICAVTTIRNVHRKKRKIVVEGG